MKTVALLLTLGLLLAGCSGNGGESSTTAGPSCANAGPNHGDGHNHASHAAGCDGNRTLAPPSVRLDTAPASVQVYRSINVTWTILPGEYTKGHSMLSKVMLSHHSVPTSELVGPDSYGVKEIGRTEHADLADGTGKTVTVTSPAGTFSPDLQGTRYIRVYAQIRAEGLEDKDYWSDEVAINVTAVQPTGVTHTVTHGAGGFQGGLDPDEVNARLGDALSFANEDVVEHTFTLASGPAGCPFAPIKVPAGVPTAAPPSTPVLLLCPGSFSFETDDVPTMLTVAINVVA